jgi:hypothetical protein
MGSVNVRRIDSDPIARHPVEHSLGAANHGLCAILDCAKNIVMGDIIIGVDTVRNRSGAVAKNGIAGEVGDDTETGLNLVFGDVDVKGHSCIL